MAFGVSKSTLHKVGNFDLVDQIAEGGMGTVYKGRNRETGQIVAIKIAPESMADNQTLHARFQKEFAAASKIDHPNVVRALDYGVLGGRPYLVMEFVDGESLGQRIERDGRIPEAEAIQLIALAAQGLHHAHKSGMVHRDVKPDNIIVTKDGQVKLLDLGLVKEADNDINLTRTGRGLGTPHFMAPEQFRNAKNADVKCDIYSLGATLYQMVTGELPFRSMGPLDAWMKKINNELTPPIQLATDLSERINWAILRAMSADPEKRPDSCREFIEDLTGHSTRKVVVPATDGATPEELWYLQYKDETGETHLVKGNMAGIRRSLKEGLLGDASNVVASRSKSGEFMPLKSHPEFRDLVVSAAPLSSRSNSAVMPLPENKPATTGSRPGSGTATPSTGPTTPASGVTVPTPRPPSSGQHQAIPHIPLEPTGPRPEWLLWGLLLALAMALGAAATFFFR
jgi:eukaryotic-like serine/threonine-protein kinase